MAVGDTKKPRVEPVLTGISTTVPMPERKSKRGSVSLYRFDDLTAVGASFGVKNKTAAQLSTIVSNANRKAVQPKKNAKGNTIFKTEELKGADGSITLVPTKEPETEATKRFFVVDCDPKKDPDGASARVFREA
jgi:hypothetical protein